MMKKMEYTTKTGCNRRNSESRIVKLCLNVLPSRDGGRPSVNPMNLRVLIHLQQTAIMTAIFIQEMLSAIIRTALLVKMSWARSRRSSIAARWHGCSTAVRQQVILLHGIRTSLLKVVIFIQS